MLQRGVRQSPHSRCQSRALQTHLRELVAQSSHGRLGSTRQPTSPDFPPWPCQLGFREEDVKVKLALSQRSVDFSKLEAAKNRTSQVLLK